MKVYLRYGTNCQILDRITEKSLITRWIILKLGDHGSQAHLNMEKRQWMHNSWMMQIRDVVRQFDFSLNFNIFFTIRGPLAGNSLCKWIVNRKDDIWIFFQFLMIFRRFETPWWPNPGINIAQILHTDRLNYLLQVCNSLCKWIVNRKYDIWIFVQLLGFFHDSRPWWPNPGINIAEILHTDRCHYFLQVCNSLYK